ncbi:MAG: hypothetical protein WCJ51_00725 [Candidatus Moraniibacteriota bacterium]
MKKITQARLKSELASKLSIRLSLKQLTYVLFSDLGLSYPDEFFSLPDDGNTLFSFRNSDFTGNGNGYYGKTNIQQLVTATARVLIMMLEEKIEFKFKPFNFTCKEQESGICFRDKVLTSVSLEKKEESDGEMMYVFVYIVSKNNPLFDEKKQLDSTGNPVADKSNLQPKYLPVFEGRIECKVEV